MPKIVWTLLAPTAVGVSKGTHSTLMEGVVMVILIVYHFLVVFFDVGLGQ